MGCRENRCGNRVVEYTEYRTGRARESQHEGKGSVISFVVKILAVTSVAVPNDSSSWDG